MSRPDRDPVAGRRPRVRRLRTLSALAASSLFVYLIALAPHLVHHIDDHDTPADADSTCVFPTSPDGTADIVEPAVVSAVVSPDRATDMPADRLTAVVQRSADRPDVRGPPRSTS